MKRLIFTFFLCWFVIPSAYGETISYTSVSGIQYVGEIKNGVMHGHGPVTETYAESIWEPAKQLHEH